MIRNVFLVALAALLIGGCTPPASDSGKLVVVATTTQVGEIAGELGGDAIELTTLLSPGVEAHDFELTPGAAAAVERADVILKSGAGLETWLDEALTTIGGEDRVRDMSEGIELRTIIEDGQEETDPHYWLSAPNAILMVNNVRDALTAAAHAAAADGIAQRAEDYTARLSAADDQVRGLIADIPEQSRGIVTNHDALGYFIDEYGLRFVGSVFSSLDVTAEPDPGQLAELADTIRAAGVKAIFSESAVNPRLEEAIAQETGAQVVADPLYTDSLGPPGSGADTLDGMLLHDATVIHDALSG
jgi:zinc/manganese transport system substrate-binding protein